MLICLANLNPLFVPIIDHQPHAFTEPLGARTADTVLARIAIAAAEQREVVERVGGLLAIGAGHGFNPLLICWRAIPPWFTCARLRQQQGRGAGCSPSRSGHSCEPPA